MAISNYGIAKWRMANGHRVEQAFMPALKVPKNLGFSP
jgi:hypothetical protein